jgi:hypothetical protein
VLADEGGLEELRRLGVRSVPVVSRGDRFVFAQVISDVVEFLGLDEKTGPALSPAELHTRYDHVLETAIRLVRQMPNDRLEDQLPHRPRSYRMLMHRFIQLMQLDVPSALSWRSLPLAGNRGPGSTFAVGTGFRRCSGI